MTMLNQTGRISVELADMRASLRKELARLNARAFEGGPDVVVRQGVLLASFDRSCFEVTHNHIHALRDLPDGAGSGAVRSTMGWAT